MGLRGIREDLTGQTFERLLVLKEAPSRWEGRIRYYFLVRCECGMEFEVRGAALKHGSPKECLQCSRATTGFKLRKETEDRK